ncbi:MAG: hypothetical protein KC897_08020 [Candidatus Omnitrophica bacterium]|nr:hypothetical protein [Candidatus Omnitrophota bacterium]MCB9720721.1 hypothetical protein [Candidatus Omnitrophota bacterium]
MRNTLFYCCLLTSSLVHFAVIKSLNSNRKFKLPPPKKTMEVTYQKIKTVKVEPPPEPEPKQEVSIAKEKQIRRDVKVLDKESDHFTVFDKEVKDISKFSKRVSLDKKRSPKIKTLDGQRKMFVDMVQSEKIQNPVYLDYQMRLRNQIRDRVRQYFVGYTGYEAGKVRIAFIVSALGELKAIRISEEHTSANERMRELGLKSVEDAFPFSAIPKNLPYSELTFNIEIIFTPEAGDVAER